MFGTKLWRLAAISPNPGLSLVPGSSLRPLARLTISPLGGQNRCFLYRPQSQSKHTAATTTTNTTATTTTTTTTNCSARRYYCRSLQPSPQLGVECCPFLLASAAKNMALQLPSHGCMQEATPKHSKLPRTTQIPNPKNLSQNGCDRSWLWWRWQWWWWWWCEVGG